MSTPSKDLPVIGIVEPVSIGKHVINVPAKIDTGADGSSIWASNIRINSDGILCFSLFGEGSKYYNGKVFKRKDYSAVKVKSSTGHIQYRYSINFTIRIASKKIHVRFTLADRSNNNFKILIGRRTISRKFLVDVSKGRERLPIRPKNVRPIHEELTKDPYKFHEKYVKPKLEGK